jgi:hypothetical protein
VPPHIPPARLFSYNRDKLFEQPIGLGPRRKREWGQVSGMASWLVKAIVQRGIGALPNPHYWNEFFQERVTCSLDLTDEKFHWSLGDCRKHLESLQRYATTPPDGFSVFELGTGWYPVVPIGLFLCGAREVWTWDIVPLLKPDRLKLTIDRFLELEKRQVLQDHLRALPERLALLRKVRSLCESEGWHPARVLEQLGIYYLIGSASRSGLSPQSVNLVMSDGVLQYLSPEALVEVFREFRRIAAPDGVMSHIIGLGDEYATFDPGITQFNFLRFSDRLWRWLNNPIIPLNRLRVSDYRRVCSESGFEIVGETSVRGDPAELARTPLAAKFREYPVEDLLVLCTWLVAVPRVS